MPSSHNSLDPALATAFPTERLIGRSARELCCNPCNWTPPAKRWTRSCCSARDRWTRCLYTRKGKLPWRPGRHTTAATSPPGARQGWLLERQIEYEADRGVASMVSVRVMVSLPCSCWLTACSSKGPRLGCRHSRLERAAWEARFLASRRAEGPQVATMKSAVLTTAVATQSLIQGWQAPSQRAAPRLRRTPRRLRPAADRLTSRRP